MLEEVLWYFSNSGVSKTVQPRYKGPYILIEMNIILLWLISLVIKGFNAYLLLSLVEVVEEPNTQRFLSQPVVVSSKLQIPGLPLRWEQQSKLLPSVAGIPASKVSKWSTDEVGFPCICCLTANIFKFLVDSELHINLINCKWWLSTWRLESARPADPQNAHSAAISSWKQWIFILYMYRYRCMHT